MLSISRKTLCGSETLLWRISTFRGVKKSAGKSLINWNKGLTRWSVCGTISCYSVSSFAAAKSLTHFLSQQASVRSLRLFLSLNTWVMPCMTHPFSQCQRCSVLQERCTVGPNACWLFQLHALSGHLSYGQKFNNTCMYLCMECV